MRPVGDSLTPAGPGGCLCFCLNGKTAAHTGDPSRPVHLSVFVFFFSELIGAILSILLWSPPPSRPGNTTSGDSVGNQPQSELCAALKCQEPAAGPQPAGGLGSWTLTCRWDTDCGNPGRPGPRGEVENLTVTRRLLN